MIFYPALSISISESASMGSQEQAQMWLKIWTDVALRTQETGGVCYVMANGTGEHDRVIEGSAQHGEINIAHGFGIPVEYVYY